jgi:hypothetical protein
MIDYSVSYVYGLLAWFLSVDVRLKKVVNPTHIRSRGVMHRNHTLRERCDNVTTKTY